MSEGTYGAIYLEAIQWARKNNQTVGEKNDYYVTLEQLEAILKNVYERKELVNK